MYPTKDWYSEYRKNFWDSVRKRQTTHKKIGQDLAFTKEEIQIVNNQLKMCSTLLVIREMHTRTNMSYHFTSMRLAKINKTK